MGASRLYVKFVRGMARVGLARWKVRGELLTQPAVYIVHHQNMFGPVHALALLPLQLQPWALSVFCSFRECFAQYFHYTFTQRFGLPVVLAFLPALLCSLAVPPLMRGLRAIRVYRRSRDVVKTMRLSADTLCGGHNVLICPDKDYSDDDAAIGTVYRGFLRLEKDYYAKTGQHLSFVPVYCSKKQKRLELLPPIQFEDGSFRAQQNQVAERLAQSLNAAARRCGDLDCGSGAGVCA